MTLPRRVDGTPEVRFHARIEVVGDCWLWRGAINRAGYGQFWVNGRATYVHRWSYEHFVGPIPDDRPHLGHLCKTTACANSAHLEPVTQQENNRRTRLNGCRRGHGPESEYRDSAGQRRYCRECRRIRDREQAAQRGGWRKSSTKEFANGA